MAEPRSFVPDLGEAEACKVALRFWVESIRVLVDCPPAWKANMAVFDDRTDANEVDGVKVVGESSGGRRILNFI